MFDLCMAVNVQNPVTFPQGTLLMRNEQGQLMLVQTGPGQPGGATIHPSSVITTTSVPITTSTGFKIQRVGSFVTDHCCKPLIKVTDDHIKLF